MRWTKGRQVVLSDRECSHGQIFRLIFKYPDKSFTPRKSGFLAYPANIRVYMQGCQGVMLFEGI